METIVWQFKIFQLKLA